MPRLARDAAPPATSAPSEPRPGAALAALVAAAARLGSDAAGALQPARVGGAGDAGVRRPRPFARISSGAEAAPSPPERRGGVLSLAFGGARAVAGVALLPLRLPLRLLPLPKQGSGGSGEASPLTAAPALSRAARERAGTKARAAAAKEETRALFLYPNATERARVADFFAMLASPDWRLETVHQPSGTEVWRLKAAKGGKIHCIMGVADVAAAPKIALELFQDPAAVFTRVFPRVDAMFMRGTVLASARGGFAACVARFRLPSLVGEGAAPGFPAREFCWSQYVTRLSSGNVLVTARSCDGDGADAAAARADPRCPPAAALPPPRGAVRGRLLTSGYYGRRVGPDTSRVYYIVQADPAGLLPAWLVNLASAKQAHNVTRLAAMFRDGKMVA